MPDDLQLRCYNLTFAVEKSMRYHRRHASWFFAVNRLMTFASALAGTGVVVALLQKRPDGSAALGVIVAAVGTVQLVFDLEGKGRENARALESFTSLRQEINRSPVYDLPTLISWENRRTEIEALHVAELDALNVDCHNQVLEAQGRADIPRRQIGWLQRIFLHLVSWQQEFPEVRPRSTRGKLATR